MRRSDLGRSVRLLSAVLLFASFAGAAPPSLRFPTALPAWDQEASEADNACRRARLDGDDAAMRSLSTTLLAEHGDKDWAVENAAYCLIELLPYAEMKRVLVTRDSATLGTPPLSDPAWDLLAALFWKDHDRAATADSLLARVESARPDWTLVQGLRFETGLDLLRPAAELQSRIDAAAASAPAFDQIFRWLFNRIDDDAELARAAATLLASDSLRPDYAACKDWLEVQAELDAPDRTADDFRRLWREFRARHAALAPAFRGRFAGLVENLLPTADALSLLAEIDPGAPDTDVVVRRASLLADLQRSIAARDLLAAHDLRDGHALSVELGIITIVGAAAPILALHDRLAEEYPGYAAWAQFTHGTKSADQGRRQTETLALCARENPLDRLQVRLLALSREEPQRAVALLDSLDAAGVPREALLRERTSALARVAPPRSLLDILMQASASDRRQDLRVAMQRATRDGDRTALLDAAGAFLSASQGRLPDLVLLHGMLMDQDATDLAARTLAAAEACAPDDPLVLDLRVRQLYRVGSPTEVAALLDTVDPDAPAWSEPEHQLLLANLAHHFQRLDLLDRVSRNVESAAPGSYMALSARASALEQLQRHDEAAALLHALAVDHPYDPTIAERLLNVQESVLTLADFPDLEPHDDDPFAVFGELDDSVAALQAMRLPQARADTTSADAVVLLNRNSVVLEGLEKDRRRLRFVAQILTQTGAEQSRLHTIPFAANSGVPRLLQARVVAPDGTVFETPPADVLIRADDGQDSNVSDQRVMSIPLRGLEPGSLIEVITETTYQSYLKDWSFLYGLWADPPIERFVLEVAAPPSVHLRAVTHGAVTEAETDGRCRRWVAENLRDAEEEEWSPAWTEVIPWVGLTTSRDWDEVAASYAEPFWRQCVTEPAVAAKAAEIVAGLSGDEERLEALHRWVVREIDGLAVELGEGRLIPTTPAQVLERGWGDCKDCSSLLIAMLDAVGIEARPVLVATAGSTVPREDFPTTRTFNHMIVQATGVAGRPYCDPLNSADCVRPLPAADTGRLALHLDRDGGSSLTAIPEADPADHLVELTLDVRPVNATTLRYDVAGRYTGAPAGYMRTLAAVADTTFQKQFLDTSTGYGVPEGVEISRWSFQEEPCGAIGTALTYVDTTWVHQGAVEALTQNICEASNYWGLPDRDDRRTDVVWPAPYRARVVVRLHDSDMWVLDDRIAEHRLRGKHHEGRISIAREKEDGHRVLAVTMAYDLKDRIIPTADVRDHVNECLGFFMHAAALRRWFRAIDEEQLAQDMEYLRDFPEDLGVRFNAALRLLGTEMGGNGGDASRRRLLAADILRPSLTNDQALPFASIMLGAMAGKEGRYQYGDSLIDAAVARVPDDKTLLNAQQLMKAELGRLEERVVPLERLAQMGDAEAVVALLLTYAMLDREDDIQRHLRRMERLGRPITPTQLTMLRAFARSEMDDGPGLQAILDAHGDSFDEPIRRQLRQLTFMQTEDWPAAAALAEEIMTEAPTDPTALNNYAWCCAMGGFDLDRALELAEAATLLSNDPTASGNTLAAVHARRGDWKKARELFQELYRGDDRPKHRVVNGFFLGLCEAQLGDSEKALRIWEGLELEGATGYWRGVVEEGKRILEDGGEVGLGVFGG